MRIKAAEFLKAVNAAGRGQVISERTLRRHRAELGMGAEIEIGRYVAHLVDRFQRLEVRDAVDAYDLKKEKARERSAEASSTGRDIAPLPDVGDRQRKEACRADLRLFCETYLADTFSKGWSEDHLRVIASLQEAILTGGQFALAMPRGSGKTSLTEAATLWAIFYGHRRFVIIIGATAEAAKEILDSIKMQVETNEELGADFPEICYPVERLEGITKRCQGQVYQGERTHLTWKDKEIIFPTIPGSLASGAVVRARGLTGGGIRGQRKTTADGHTMRPDFAILDDPQTDESARSPEQNNTRQKLINGTVLGMAGPGKKIACVMPCTVICPDDLAARFLDRKLNPEWHGLRLQLMVSHPKNEALWEQYFDLRKEDLANDRGVERANSFYRKNRKAMDDGAQASWEERLNDDELSAIQHAMHLKDRDPLVYAAEYQNDPIDAVASDIELLSADDFAAKVSGVAHLVVPDFGEYLVAFTDVQKRALYWGVAAVAPDFTGQVIDYGPFPSQPTRYFTYGRIHRQFGHLKTAQGRSLAKLSEEAQIRQALELFVNDDLMERTYVRQDGLEQQIQLCLVDAGWHWNVIVRFIKQSPHKMRLVPSKGRGVGAVNKPISEGKPKLGDRIGEEWIMPKPPPRQGVRHVIYDANYWKSFHHSRWSTPAGEMGSWNLYHGKPGHHRMIAEHFSSEYYVPVTAHGRTVDEWKLRVGRDNHLLDVGVGCCVAASILGAQLPETDTKRIKKKRGPRLKLSEMRKQRRSG